MYFSLKKKDYLRNAIIQRISVCKLYDLMTMALKYQVSLAVWPNDILLVTLNHMDAIRQFAIENEQATSQVNRVYDLLSTVCPSIALTKGPVTAN